MDQPEGWLPHKNLPSLAMYATEHEATTPIKQSVGMQEQIDVDRLTLLLKQLEYDQRVYETWVKKCSSAQTARFHTQQSWRLDQFQRCKQNAEKLLSQAVKAIFWDRKAEHVITEIIHFRKRHNSKLDAHLMRFNSSSLLISRRSVRFLPRSIIT